LTQFIELHQYLVGSFYNEVGLNANYNMKREALSESETGLNDDSLMPLCEDMLRCRQEDFDRVNAMFGTSIQVDLDSSWLENEIERLLSLRQQASEASSQLVNTAPLEAGMGEVSIEGASMEGAGMEMDGGMMNDENGIDENEDVGTEENSEDEAGDPGDEAGDEDARNPEGDGADELEQEPSEGASTETVDVNVNINIDEGSTEEESTEEDSKEEDSNEDSGKEEDNESKED